MTKQERLDLLKARLSILSSNPKNLKCPGVVKKITRQIRNLEK